ncbi:family 43 glycosylhydrolase [Streptomyces sp. SB3404]|uniref:Family 43 glycosylhydrolase n=1 Tax=Streptomyces boncukensis TaxID=2711219 RepID=A0A6G4WZP4_9ACTN|nr:family 43 glycosylhydrolase [Streptomyces boncukensis]
MDRENMPEHAPGTTGRAHAAPHGPVTVTNGTRFTTATGEPLHAHGGGMLRADGHFYWFGENRNPDNTFRSVSAYRSRDLKTWEFRNHILTRETDPELATANIERPKVLYNPGTRQYVLWAHKENGNDYGEARACVASCPQIDGDYTWHGSFRPLGHMSRDLTLYQEESGEAAYLVSAARDNGDLHLYRLADDCLAVAELVANPWPGGHREAPALFRHDGGYVMLTSGLSGWRPNQQQYATAPALTGPWTDMRNVGDATAFDSQTACVLTLRGTRETTHLYLGDRWGNASGGTVNDSRYVWLPLRFSDATTMTMDWQNKLTIDVEAGTVY